MCSKFPKTLYITKNEDGDDTYFIPNEALKDTGAEDGDEVAIYKLQRVGKLNITMSLEGTE